MSLYGNKLYGNSLYQKSTLGVGLIAHWPCDETTGTNVPELISANNGTLINTTDAAWVAGKIGLGAVELDGVSDHMTYGTALINRDVGSVAHWVFPDVTRLQILLYESDGTTGNHNGLGDPNNDILEIHSAMDASGKANFTFQRGDPSTTGGMVTVASATSLPLATWTHLTYTWDINGDLKVYFNGVLDGTSDMSGDTFPAKTTTVRNIGRVGDGTATRHWNGRFDEPRVYDRILSASEAAELAVLGV